MNKITACVVLLTTMQASAQLTVERGATLYLQDKAVITVNSDLVSWSNIEGGGQLVLTGGRANRIDVHGYEIANLVIEVPSMLQSDLRITSHLDLRSAILRMNNYNVTLDKDAIIKGSANGYVETSGTGTVRKISSGALSRYFIPMGTMQSYLPVELNTLTTSGKGMIVIAARDGISRHKPLSVVNFIKHYWLVQQEGDIENLTVTGHILSRDVEGNASELSSFYWDGYSWKAQLNKQEGIGEFKAAITAASGEIYAMSLPNSVAGLRLLNNPARYFVVLEINSPVDEKYHVVLRDFTGRQLKQMDIVAVRGVNRHTIYLDGLAAAAYILEVVSRSRTETFKFTKH